MTGTAPKVLCLVSAPPGLARSHVEELLAEHAGADFTFYVRTADAAGLADLLDGHEVRSDKPDYRGPGRGRAALIRDLRSQRFDHAVALGLGHFDFWPQKVALLLARARRKQVITERGSFRLSASWPWTLLDHLWWRHKHPVGPVAGMPEATPLPLLAAGYRRTLGLLLGVGFTLGEYGIRRLLRR